MNTLDELVQVHNLNRKKGKVMTKMAYIVFNHSGDVFGVYEELVDAEDRVSELNEYEHIPYFIEEYPMNKDFDPVD